MTNSHAKQTHTRMLREHEMFLANHQISRASDFHPDHLCAIRNYLNLFFYSFAIKCHRCSHFLHCLVCGMSFDVEAFFKHGDYWPVYEKDGHLQISISFCFTNQFHFRVSAFYEADSTLRECVIFVPS